MWDPSLTRRPLLRRAVGRCRAGPVRKPRGSRRSAPLALPGLAPLGRLPSPRAPEGGGVPGCAGPGPRGGVCWHRPRTASPQPGTRRIHCAAESYRRYAAAGFLSQKQSQRVIGAGPDEAGEDRALTRGGISAGEGEALVAAHQPRRDSPLAPCRGGTHSGVQTSPLPFGCPRVFGEQGRCGKEYWGQIWAK